MWSCWRVVELTVGKIAEVGRTIEVVRIDPPGSVKEVGRVIGAYSQCILARLKQHEDLKHGEFSPT